MKYIVQVEISVEADNDDAALFWIQDTINMSGIPMSVHKWIRTTIEGESNE